MTIIVCVRHGDCEPIGKYIAGRSAGIYLNDNWRQQVTQLAAYFKTFKISGVYSSPLERACETASIICEYIDVKYEVIQELNEINYGDWTGKTFDELSKISLWRDYNNKKGLQRIPGGEMLIEIENRMAYFVEILRKKIDGIVILVSHADPIKCLIAHYTGMAIDTIDRIEISPASVSVIKVDDFGAQILNVNYKGFTM